jgi:hypothetical protein
MSEKKHWVVIKDDRQQSPSRKTRKRSVVIKADRQRELDAGMRRQIAKSDQSADVRLGQLCARDVPDHRPAVIFTDVSGRETGRHTDGATLEKVDRVSFDNIVFAKAADPFTPKRIESLDL